MPSTPYQQPTAFYCFSRFWRLQVAVLVFGLSLAPAFGAVLISTLGQTDDAGIVFSSIPAYLATDFQTGADSATFTSLTLRLSNSDNIAHTFIAELWSDNSGVPGGLLHTFANTFTIAPNPTAANYTEADAGAVLSATTIYWLVLRLGEARNVGSPSVLLTLGQDVNPGGFFSGVGATDLKVSGDGVSWIDVADFTPIYELQGIVPVPEPVNVSLAVLGGAFGLVQLARTPRLRKWLQQAAPR